MNCRICGRHLSRLDIGKWKKDGHPICSVCRKQQLKETLAKASPTQVEILKLHTDDADLIDEIIKEQAASKAPEKDEHGCIIGVEKWNSDLHQCVRIEKHPPTHEQIPPLPRKTEVGPPEAVVGEQIEQIEQKLAKIKAQLTRFIEILATSGYDTSTLDTGILKPM